MDAREAAREAVRKVQELMSRTTCSERHAIETFLEELDAYTEGLNMRLEELEDEEDEEDEDEDEDA